MDRRSFLAMTAMTAFGAEPAPIGIGFLGASHSHFKGKFDVIRESKDWRVIGIAEQNKSVGADLAKLGASVLSRADLLSHPEIKVIAVESAVRDHAADAMAVLESGKHLHLEKAPAHRIGDFKEVVGLARSRDRLMQIGYMWRYHPGIAKALEAARNGWLGSIYLVHASISNQLEPERRAEWGEFKGGPMFDLGGHVIDPIARLMGRPKNVTVTLHKELPLNDGLHDNTMAMLEWDKAVGVVHASDLQPGSGRYRSIEIFGTDGCAIVNPIEPPVLKIEVAKNAGPYKKGIQSIPMPAYRRFVDDFADLAGAVRGERKLPISFEQELLVEETLLRCSGMA